MEDFSILSPSEIEEIAREKGFNQQKLAEEIGVSKSTVVGFLNGKKITPRISKKFILFVNKNKRKVDGEADIKLDTYLKLFKKFAATLSQTELIDVLSKAELYFRESFNRTEQQWIDLTKNKKEDR